MDQEKDEQSINDETNVKHGCKVEESYAQGKDSTTEDRTAIQAKIGKDSTTEDRTAMQAKIEELETVVTKQTDEIKSLWQAIVAINLRLNNSDNAQSESRTEQKASGKETSGEKIHVKRKKNVEFVEKETEPPAPEKCQGAEVTPPTPSPTVPIEGAHASPAADLGITLFKQRKHSAC